MIRKLLPVATEGAIQPGQTKTFRYGFREGIAYNDEGTLKAYVNFCTHMGGPTELRGGILRCRWHEAEFSPCTGERLCGQAPEGTRLAPIELVTENGQIFAVLEINDDL